MYITWKNDVKECKARTANLTRNLYQQDEMFPIHSVHQIENLLVEIFFQVASKWIWAYRTFLKNLTFLSKIVPLFKNYFQCAQKLLRRRSDDVIFEYMVFYFGCYCTEKINKINKTSYFFKWMKCILPQPSVANRIATTTPTTVNSVFFERMFFSYFKEFKFNFCLLFGRYRRQNRNVR